MSEDLSLSEGKSFSKFFLCLFATIGAMRLLYALSALSYNLWCTLVRPKIQERDRAYDEYGRKDSNKKSWAVVTGASDGIGFSMAAVLARQGFNIVMVSRNEKKMEEKVIELRKKVF